MKKVQQNDWWKKDETTAMNSQEAVRQPIKNCLTIVRVLLH